MGLYFLAHLEKRQSFHEVINQTGRNRRNRFFLFGKKQVETVSTVELY